MLALFETPAGFALFKVLDEQKLNSVEDIWKEFESPDAARKAVKLKAFQKFANTAEALGAATAIVDSKLSKGLKKFLKKEVQGETLAIADSKLGKIVSDKLNINCVYNSAVMELMRGVRSQLAELISGLAGQDMGAMSLGLSHSLSRYKLKFSPDKVDTMIVQAIGLLDDLDKELNTYAMRVREWYGWHFPELGKIVQDNINYAKVVKLMGSRESVGEIDFSGILEEEVEAEMKEAANISMGTEVSEHDMLNIKALCDQVIALAEYRGQLYDYLRTRMIAIAPNLTTMVGELVGARLIAHAGSLINLAKQPASTVQILGAEKALFRALKTKHETPKYGLIYHASLIGQAPPKFKGKIARVLAAKSALSTRVDALGDDSNATIGLEDRLKVEARLRSLEGRALNKLSGASKGNAKVEAYDKDRKKDTPGLITAAKSYNPAADSTVGLPQPVETAGGQEKKKKKREAEEPAAAPVAAIEPAPEEPPKKKKKPTEEEVAVTPVAVEQPKKKKKEKASAGTAVATPTPPVADQEQTVKKKKEKAEQSATEKVATKKRKVEVTVGETTVEATNGSESVEKKKKKKKKQAD